MKIFTLTRTVHYEGSSLLGVFASVADCINHLNKLDGYLMDEWSCDETSPQAFFDQWDWARVRNCVDGWKIEGPGDVSFAIYEIELGA